MLNGRGDSGSLVPHLSSTEMPSPDSWLPNTDKAQRDSYRRQAAIQSQSQTESQSESHPIASSSSLVSR